MSFRSTTSMNTTSTDTPRASSIDTGPEAINTRFLIISDTHDFKFGEADQYANSLKHPLPKVDVLLHCGDMTCEGRPEDFEGVVEMLSQIDADLKLVIAGRHDLALDKTYWQPRRNRIQANRLQYVDEYGNALKILRGQLATRSGIQYLEEGHHEFDLRNGAKLSIYTSQYTPELNGWAFPYAKDEDRFNQPEDVRPGHQYMDKNPIPDVHAGDPPIHPIDIVMTHGPPMYFLDLDEQDHFQGCDTLLRAVSRVQPKLHCFGGMHEAYGGVGVKWKPERGSLGFDAVEGARRLSNNYPEATKYPFEVERETFMINACIKDSEFCPKNPPWLVELELEPIGLAQEEDSESMSSESFESIVKAEEEHEEVRVTVQDKEWRRGQDASDDSVDQALEFKGLGI